MGVTGVLGGEGPKCPFSMPPTQDHSPNAAGAQELERLAVALKGAADGNEAPLGEFYAAVYPGALRLCRGFLAHRSEAEDVAQDVMLRLVDSIQRWDPARPFAAWSRTVVLNRCRSHARSSATRRAHEVAAGAVWAEGLAPSPEVAAERGELTSMINAALSVLPPREREVFVLLDLEGLTTGEVAETLDVTPSTVRAALAMARRRLRDALAPHLAPAAGHGRPGGDQTP